ncbi:DUF4214 domain-containing protein [Xylanimonas allomyrinae]|uniref:DUF4214 domain-containing protein n=1 Tax=Xylanimonas allomyrinae TaxID=2509459 RepID=A0A4P6ESM8_9MICO|nr:DUF4214 domain-containing protein [Xylanimonas allomyrinae]QAY63407.1 DUF4214 domain-containing protein [Xylanimonas allomyrinae]
MRRTNTAGAIATALVGALVLAALPGLPGEPRADAAPLRTATSASQFDAGNIIADGVFYAPSTMDAGQVQAFLNQQGAGCVAGEQPCLKDYRTATPSMAAEAGLCGAYSGSGSQSAAEIITNVGRACGINQQVLLVLLQKETSLVTKTRPTTSNYNRATGFGCPDTGPNHTANCDAAYYGFFNQLYRAARQYLRYRNNPTGYGYQAGRVNSILYNPNTACGSAQVYIQNQATAGLYNYTPYVPNAAALANFYGTGDSCSSYGNRNFFRIFSDWFGDPRGSEAPIVKKLYADLLGREVDPSGLATWTNDLRAGRSQSELVRTLTSSTEYRTLRVVQAYREVLRREPDPHYVDWVRWIQEGVYTVDEVQFVFYRTEEFYLQGGANPTDYVKHMYRVMLNREASAWEIAYWTDQIAHYGVVPATAGVWFSLEAAMIRAGKYYQTFLGRAPDPVGLDQWAHVMLASGEGAVREGIAGSVEYRNLAIRDYS